MADYFADTSALIKRYVEEDGSDWISNLCNDKSNFIYVAAITRVELVAALTRRGKGGLSSPGEAVAACADFRSDLKRDYFSVDASNYVLDRAAELAEKHAMRGYDAVQFAAAIEANLTVTAAQLPPLTLLSSDREMNAAAVPRGPGGRRSREPQVAFRPKNIRLNFA